MKNLCKNRRYLTAQNHVSHYTLHLFYTFAIFGEHRKINAKRDAKSCNFWLKNWPWAPQGRLILPFLLILWIWKNHRFFDAAPTDQKIKKIGPSGNIKPIQGKRLDPRVSIFGNQGPRAPPFSRAPANRKRAKGKQETRSKPKKGSNTPIGRWPGEIFRMFGFGCLGG